MIENKVIKALCLLIKQKYNIDLEANISLSKSPKKEFGEFSFPCFLLSKPLKKNPIEVALELAEFIKQNDIIEEAKAVGLYLNLKIKNNIYTEIFNDTYCKKENFTVYATGKDKTIYIDYIGTNVGKPLHIGHICAPLQGQSLANLYKKLGYTVITDSHIGDWGIIFGKLIYAYKKYGNEKKLEKDAVNHLFELYVKISTEADENPTIEQEFRAEFKKLSLGDKESIKLWESFTKKSIESMEIQLNRLGVKPDYNIGESFYEGLSLPKMENYPDLKYDMKSIVKELIEKKVATKNHDNSVGIEFSEKTKIPSCILQKRDGTHGYLASDLASIKYRMHNWKTLEKIVYCVDVRQKLHFQQVFEASKLAGWVKPEKTSLIHANNGFISLKDGAMSTRKGKIIKLDKLLDESEDRAKKIILEKRSDLSQEELSNLSKIIGIGAIKYGYLKKSRETDVIFDWGEFMTFEGNSGPYIQYAYVRAKRILEKALEKGINIDTDTKQVFFEQPEEIELVKALLNYEKTLLQVADVNYSHLLCEYTYNLTKVFNTFYNSVHILNEENEGKKLLRLKLINLFTIILKESFDILGITMPENM